MGVKISQDAAAAVKHPVNCIAALITELEKAGMISDAWQSSSRKKKLPIDNQIGKSKNMSGVMRRFTAVARVI